MHEYDPPKRLQYLPAAERDTFAWMRLAPVTTALIAVNVLIFGLEELWGGSTDNLTLLRMGALVGGVGDAIAPGSIVAYGFLHIGFLHVGINMLALWNLGRALEPMLGPGRYFLMYTLSLVGGGVAIATLTEKTLTAGASGAIFGLLGAICVVMGLAHQHSDVPEQRAAIRSRIGWLLLPNLFISLLPGVSGAGHLGGLVVGAIFVVIAYVRGRGVEKRVPPEVRARRMNIVAAVFAIITLGAIASVWITHTPWTSIGSAT